MVKLHSILDTYIGHHVKVHHMADDGRDTLDPIEGTIVAMLKGSSWTYSLKVSQDEPLTPILESLVGAVVRTHSNVTVFEHERYKRPDVRYGKRKGFNDFEVIAYIDSVFSHRITTTKREFIAKNMCRLLNVA